MSPVLPVIASGPAIVAPQMRTTAAAFAGTGPVIVPPSTSSATPGSTVTARLARAAARCRPPRPPRP